jgi:tRNA threonylcarbamoyladenosine biosynthesis protein TsaE
MLERDNPKETATSFDLVDLSGTRKLGGLIASQLAVGDVVALEGDLGTGKTTLARAIIAELSGEGEAPSPTFTLVQTYPARIKGRETEIWHFDLYRLNRPEEAYELAIEDAFADGVSIIEWPSRLGPLLPADCLFTTLAMAGPHSRRVTLSGGPRWHAAIEAILKGMTP